VVCLQARQKRPFDAGVGLIRIIYTLLVTHYFVEYFNSPLKIADTVIYVILPVLIRGNICESENLCSVSYKYEPLRCDMAEPGTKIKPHSPNEYHPLGCSTVKQTANMRLNCPAVLKHTLRMQYVPKQ
jgi:hypothetical protein